MKTMDENPKREELLRYISRATSYGNLGLFVGTGFCKAVLNDGLDDIALSWGELLKRSAAELGVDYSAIRKEGANYPEIASAPLLFD
jgi:hypothetical protein